MEERDAVEQRARARRWSSGWRWAWLALAIAGGVLLGVSGFTANYAEGLSYFSTDPRACANCHIMRPQYDGWQKASHHAVATCADCHLPTTFFAKYLAKAENGWHHSKGFTLQNFEEPIQIKAKNRQILQDNCERCHREMIHELVGGGNGDLECVHCHAGVGHGERAGLGGPPRPEEAREMTREEPTP